MLDSHRFMIIYFLGEKSKSVLADTQYPIRSIKMIAYTISLPMEVNLAAGATTAAITAMIDRIPACNTDSLTKKLFHI